MELVYRPSGREPVLYVGSRRGVPYHSKIGYDWTGERPPLPRFFGQGEADALLARPDGFDFRRDVWPLVEKELGFALYRRLFTPERTNGAWTDFEEKCAAADRAEREVLVASTVPDPAGRLTSAPSLDRVETLPQERGAFRTQDAGATLRSHLGLGEPGWTG
ncbi:hypothetical protein GCM10023084_74890 [Streptomyces lacrimifluminis]|uniref:Uncharacterized protein n=1 Tax=Streptomyces lacrimifluminis TaxID=1500077 RepID=A0A917P7M7_9ACTN|nr:hypothetical protein GCM10012282_72970 [Streptomyces lacrimifluminis]